MGDSNAAGSARDDLKRSFESELERLAVAASRRSLVEGVMRLRALAEIANALETPQLLDLAVRLEARSLDGSSDGRA